MRFTKYNNPNRRRRAYRKPKRTFSEFLRIIYNMSYEQYLALNEYQQKALEVAYKDRYYI